MDKDYAKAARILGDLDDPLYLAKVDASKNPALVKKYNIRQFPSILFIRNGIAVEYNWELKADDFVELVTSFVDVAPLGHECADFSSSVLNGLREFSSSCCQGALWNVRQKFLIDEENLFSFRHFLCEYIFTAKLRKKMDMRGY